MTTIAMLVSAGEAECVGRLGPIRSRVVRAAVLRAARVPVGVLVDAVGQLPPLAGRGRRVMVYLPVDELDELDRLAAIVDAPRSRVARSGVVLLERADAGERDALLAELPPDPRFGPRMGACLTTRNPD